MAIVHGNINLMQPIGHGYTRMDRPFGFMLIVTEAFVVITFRNEELLKVRHTVQMAIIHCECFHSVKKQNVTLLYLSSKISRSLVIVMITKYLKAGLRIHFLTIYF